jgi:hypothetical protein|tara:strand:+ start:163 stop:285 length:123 start_codon:yes stop_codon:yes gene_type:complete
MIDKQTQTDLYIIISLALFFIEREVVVEVLAFIYFFLMSL